MYKEALEQFNKPWLPLTALFIFVLVFLLYLYWTFKKENKHIYDYSSQIPFEDGVKHE